MMLDRDYGIPEYPLPGGLQNQPANTNITAPTNFKLVIPKIPNTVYFCTAISVPGQTCDPLLYPSFGVVNKVPGSSVSHGDLTFTFLIDERMENINELQTWFSSMLNFKDFSSVDKVVNWMDNEAQIFFLSNKKTPVMRMTFRGLFPLSISSVTFKSTDIEAANLTATCTMGYTYYELEQLEPV